MWRRVRRSGKLSRLRLLPEAKEPPVPEITITTSCLRRARSAAALLLCASATMASCNDYPVHRLLDSFEVRVTDRLATDKPVKLDFLWVIDQSASMCQEQRALTAAFSQFTKELSKLGAIDAQMAVVTAQQAPDKSDIKVVGRFMKTPATAFPPNCMERKRQPCLTSGQCKTPFNFTFPKTTDSTMCVPKTKKTTPATVDDKGKATGSWSCKRPNEANMVANLNCSLNSYCESRCNPDNGDKDCEAIFGAGAECKIPGGGTNKDSAGCMFPPQTDSCPPADQLPDIVKQADLGKYFGCIATVGAAQTPESKFEGGFRSAWYALDKTGPNCNYDACIKSLRRCCLDGGDWCKKDQSGTATGGKCATEIKDLCEPLKDPNNCQAARLLRPDAYLVIVFISDDDDCSMKLGLNPLDKGVITKEDWENCQVLGDALGGNVALNEGNCEFKREKKTLSYAAAKTKEEKEAVDNIWCPSDCEPGSTATTHAGLLKCPKGCKVTCDFDCVMLGSPKKSDGTPKAKADVEADFTKDYASCPQHCRTDSTERQECLTNAFEDLAENVKSSSDFAPVDDYVTLFKGLKADPAKVIVAAITGDTQQASKRQAHRDRVNYYRSQLKDVGPGQAPYICAGGRGESNYGSRYIKLVDAFRDNGSFYNVCEGDSFGPALVGIAQTILKRVTKICLPQPPFVDTKTLEPIIKVTRKRGGKADVLTYNGSCNLASKDSFCIKPDNDCRAGKTNLVGVNAKCAGARDCTAGLTCLSGTCQVYSDAIFFPVVQEPGDEIEVNFEADLGL